MSFFRNIRSSITRGKSSSRDPTPVRSSSSQLGRRDSTGSRADSLLNRGDTFILSGSDEDQRSGNHSNTSTLDKKSKKSKVFSKFSTFTKRKKTPSPEESSFEHHPSDSATNTYYKWKTDSDRIIDYDAQTDPFNFLYEQHSSLKSLQADGKPDGVRRQASVSSNSSGKTYDSGTYCKSKAPTQLREQLEQLKTFSNDDLHEQNEEVECEKYKTVTLNNFRKSFREKLLQQQKNAPHNAAWFVEVDPPPLAHETSHRRSSKENRPDFLVFENENYRPMSRSPLRERLSRATSRSPVKRNETFRVEQSSLRRPSPSPAPAGEIRVEIKNSIMPNLPGRLVPVGVAKPMPTTEYYAQRLLASNAALNAAPSSARSWQYNQRNPITANPRIEANASASGPHQTLVQIGSSSGDPKASHYLPRGRASTRINLTSSQTQTRPIAQKHLNYGSPNKSYTDSGSSRFTYGTPTRYSASVIGHGSAVPKDTKPPQATYFGDHQSQYQQHHQHQLQRQQPQQQYHQPSRTFVSNSSNGSNITNNNGMYSTGVMYNNKPHRKPLSYAQTRSLTGVGGSSGGGGALFLSRPDQQQAASAALASAEPMAHRSAVSMQRRSRSPIKIPWR